MHKFNRNDHGLMPLGKIKMQDGLSLDQLVALDAFARKWQCDTLAEAATEILRDALEPGGPLSPK